VRLPARAERNASAAAMVLFPTPPFPETIHNLLSRRPAIESGEP
jgi:hypothetical protein